VDIIKKLLKANKGKTHSLHELTLGSESISDFEKLHNPKLDISHIIPIPALLIQVFIDLPSTEPIPVALAFLKTMYDYDAKLDDTSNTESPEDAFFSSRCQQQ
jgi:hypothetical protein